MRRLLLPITAVLLLASACSYIPHNAQPFPEWLEGVKQDARKQGISEATISSALDGLTPDDRVITLDRKQPEVTQTLDQYLLHVVTHQRIEQGRRELAENKALLARIGKAYGVQPRFILALWGIETNYGSHTGGFQTIDALATLAYDGRRSAYFRDELMKALHIVDEEHMFAGDLEGSWAGALGQCQFMPSSYLRFAVDYDHDGRRDIWHDRADVFASIANYLSTSGWNGGEGWGRPVQLPEHFDMHLADIGKSKPLRQWSRLGVRNADGSPLPAKDIPASLITVGEGDDAATYLIYGNYKVILKWNRSRYFATAVGTLADAIGR